MTTASVAAPPAARSRSGPRALSRARPELWGLMALAAALNLWNLSLNGWANTYYSAAVRSMSTSWHAFLYGSFDAAGVMTVDKPPLALWVQALSARAFGFHPLSVLVPEALMGVATVALVYDLTRRRFGRAAGFGAGLVLALTPIAVAISRHNNPDALLVLCSAGALWCLVRALEDGRTRWLVWCGACVGLGFEAKMAVALMVVPGIAAAWLWVAPRGRRAAVGQLAACGAAMVAVGGAWPLLVALTPAADRPWISGTADNSVWSLIFGYNGLGRLSGQAGGPGGAAGGPGGGGFGGGRLFGGDPGPLRLLNQALGGQAGWFLGFALVAGAAVVVACRLRRRDARTGWIVAVGGAFVTTGVAFSAARGIFHPYYVSLMAPSTAALVGAGAAQLARGGTPSRVLAPMAVAAGVLAEVKVLADNPGQLTWLSGALVAAGALLAAVLLWLGDARRRAAVLAAAVAVLLVAPAAWAAQTPGHATDGTFPAGGPQTAGMGGGSGRLGAPPGGAGGAAGGMFGGDGSSLNAALAHARAHGGGTVAVSSQQGASGAVIAGEDVAALGGFSGRESEVGVSWLAGAVATGEVRWVLTGGGAFGGPQDARTGSRSVMAAVQSRCAGVSSVSGLYDCRGRAAALTAASG